MASVPDTQRGPRGELLAVRVTRGTRARLAALASARGASLGATVEAAIEALAGVGAPGGSQAPRPPCHGSG